MSVTLSDLIAAAQRFAAENLDGAIATYLDIGLLGEDTPFHVPLPKKNGTPLPPTHPSEGEQQEPGDSRFYALMGDILEVITAAKRPLTGLAIKAALSKAEKEWSDRWVDEMLARMMKDGAIENPPHAKPKGYRLPEGDA